MLGNHQAVIKPDIDGEPRDVEIEAVLELDLKTYKNLKCLCLKYLINDRKLKLKKQIRPQFENLIFPEKHNKRGQVSECDSRRDS